MTIIKVLAIILLLMYNFFLCLPNNLFQDKAMFCTTQNQIAEAVSISEDCLVHPLLTTGSVTAGCPGHIQAAKGGDPTTPQGNSSRV